MERIIQRQPNPGPQTEALKRMEFEILYGGARGGGKTDAGLAWLLYDKDNPQLRALVIRKNSEDLTDWVDRARTMYSPMGAVITGKPAMIQFPSGAIIRTGHLKDENAYTKYQGHEYQRMLIEELTQIPTEENYLKLISSCRSTVDGLTPQVFMTTNPGGIGHSWVKKRFVDVAVPGIPYVDSITTRKRVFIPAKVEDNPVLMRKDPMYVKFLEGLPEDLKKAWRDGSWDVFETKGAIYSQYMRAARENERFVRGLYEDVLDTYIFWDIGINDHTVGIVAQFYGKEVRIIDCIRGVDEGLEYYMDIVKKKGYFEKAKQYFPHDIQVRELTYSGRTRKAYLESLGVKVNITPNIGIEDGILSTRTLFHMFWFEKETTEKLAEALSIYRKKWDEGNQVYGDPIHDWASNFADALRYLSVNYDKIIGKKDIVKMGEKRIREVTNPLTGKVTATTRGGLNPYRSW